MLRISARAGRALPATQRRLLARRLHPRNLKQTGTLLNQHAHEMRLSLAHGALLYASHVLPALWLVGKNADSPPAARLARALFHRHEAQEPLRPTRNESIPGCHLARSHRLQATFLALALAGVSEEKMREVLHASGVHALARRTKVSVSRFVRLATLLREAAAHDDPCVYGHGQSSGHLMAGLPPGLSGITILLAFAWATASSRADLLAFLVALDRQYMILTNRRLLRPCLADLSCKTWKEAWCSDAFEQSDASSPPASKRSPEHPSSSDANVGPEGLELLAYVICSQGSGRPEVAQSRHGFLNQKPVADCVEAVLHDTLSFCLWDSLTSSFRVDRLPHTADADVVSFFSHAGGVWRANPGVAWFDLCSGRPNLHYMRGVGAGHNVMPRHHVRGEVEAARGLRMQAGGGMPPAVSTFPNDGDQNVGSQDHLATDPRARTDEQRRCSSTAYELYPTLHSFTAAMSSLVGLHLEPPTVASGRVQLWPGSSATWERVDGETDSRRAVLRLERIRAIDQKVGGREGAMKSGGGSRETMPQLAVFLGDNMELAGASYTAAPSFSTMAQQPRDSEEILRITFNQQVHCYAVRSACTFHEPAWVQSLRLNWMHRWRSGEVFPAASQPALALLCHAALLDAAVHHATRRQQALGNREAMNGGGAGKAAQQPSDAAETARAILAVLSAPATEHQRRERALAWLLRAGPSTHWTLPLLLQASIATGWDDLSLDAAAAEIGRMAEGELSLLLAQMTELTPPLAALVAVRSTAHHEGAILTAVAACSDAEHAQLLRIACGFVGYSAMQRLELIHHVLKIKWGRLLGT